MLTEPITVLPGVGKARAKLLEKLDLYTVQDVLFSYPRTYKDYSKVLTPREAELGQTGLYHGQLLNLHEKQLSRNRRVITGRLVGEGGFLVVSWFTTVYRPGFSYQYRQLQKAKELWVYGQVKEGFYGLEIASGEFHLKQPKRLGLVPVYPLVSGITNSMRLNWIKFALKRLGQISECLPREIASKYMDRHQALKTIHFPANHQQLAEARTRLVFEEFFLFHISLGVLAENKEFVVHQPDGPLTKQYFANLPFTLTKGQEAAIRDVRADMESPKQMRRLIQGDVGSGKTVIAEYASVKAIDSGGQVAVMVPTEVLARQMYTRLNKTFSALGIEIALLVGGLTPKQQQQILAGLASGEIPLVVGTHALISDNVKFANLTLAIVDEQHRFGVRQRVALSDKGNADLMVMSATPIPRSLALTIYGDLNTTLITDLPAGRKQVDTRLIHPSRRDDVFRFLVQRVKEGEQGFIVFPLVEESEKLEAKAAIQEMELLSKNQLAEVRVGLVHGQMGKEKDRIMEDFYRGEIDVLLATTVVEVGMDVPNATVMIIENADRFGLAQLHQLRGRVGRSDKQAYCFLIADPKTEQAKRRVNVIRTINDGLKIAEEDLKIRGPGDLLGTRQSGEPWFKLADLIEDQPLLEQAAQAARKLLSEDPTLKKYPTLLAEVKRQQP